MKSRSAAIALSAVVFGCSNSSSPRQPELSAGDLRKSGTIQFPVTCRQEVKADFQVAVALLHSFFYEEARRRFLDIAKRDPECGMAWWGVAMTWYHPLWAPPTPDEMTKGAEAIGKAKAVGARTELEAGFIDAVDAFFNSETKAAIAAEPVEQSCHGPRVHSARAVCFQQSLERLHRTHPENLEVTVFTTLAMLATAPPTDKLYRNQLAATAILESLVEKNPEHPGIAHYIIHAYDYPTLAAKGLEAARRYGEIAPWVPHALHMPSHIYTRLGMWADTIAANLACMRAARDYSARYHSGAATNDEVHALDYLMFAYLQTAQESLAKETLAYVGKIARFFPEKEFATAYAVGAIPARWALERRRWEGAADLELWHQDLLKSFPFAEAHIQFARAIGAARLGRLEAARRSVARLEELREGLKDPKFQWWISQVEIQRLAACGWLAHAEKKDAEAERLLRDAAALEDHAGTHPVTPGQIFPAREQLGDLLVELGRAGEALEEYESSLKAFPNRFNGHYGAAFAAEKSGKAEAARTHYEHLAAMAKDGDGRREELERARRYLAAR